MDYKHTINENQIRNKNISNSKIKQMESLRFRFSDYKILEADKSSGNVVIKRNDWKSFNIKHIKDNKANFKVMNYEETTLINNATNDTKSLIFNHKNVFDDWSATMKLLYSNKTHKIGRWRSTPKVRTCSTAMIRFGSIAVRCWVVSTMFSRTKN